MCVLWALTLHYPGSLFLELLGLRNRFSHLCPGSAGCEQTAPPHSPIPHSRLGWAGLLWAGTALGSGFWGGGAVLTHRFPVRCGRHGRGGARGLCKAVTPPPRVICRHHQVGDQLGWRKEVAPTIPEGHSSWLLLLTAGPTALLCAQRQRSRHTGGPQASSQCPRSLTKWCLCLRQGQRADPNVIRDDNSVRWVELRPLKRSVRVPRAGACDGDLTRSHCGGDPVKMGSHWMGEGPHARTVAVE